LLEELKIILIDMNGNQGISEEIKSRKFRNHLLDYMEITMVHQILDSWTCNDMIKKAESYNTARKYGGISTIHKPAHQPTT